MEKETQIKLEFNGREFVILGTAHVSQASIDEVARVIDEQKPDTVAVELDEKRYQTIESPEEWKNMDVVQVLKNKQGFLLLANVCLSAYQKKMGEASGVTPGDEMVAAVRKAKELGLEQELVDRQISVTMRRAWAKTPASEKTKLMSLMFATAFTSGTMSESEVEDLKKTNEMDSMLQNLSEELPSIKEVLIDERDRYIASKIWESKGKKILAVVGIGHLQGIVDNLELIAAGKMSSDVSEIEVVPEKTAGSKVAAWIIPAIIIAAIGAGFYYGGKTKGLELMWQWAWWNAIPAAIGSLIAGGHILTILVSAIGAPFTSLCPLVGIGFLAGPVQAKIKKPSVADIENLQQDASSIKGFYRNRILKVLMVFFLSSIGSSIGTFLAGANIIAFFTNLFSR
ncbi:MAG: TraB/GumN family protein [Treponema sp.]|nr:TraB/GumN family protein [Candidatus Treponema equi]